MKFTWRPGHSLDHRPIKRRRAKIGRRNAQQGISKSQELEFVLETFPISSTFPHVQSTTTDVRSPSDTAKDVPLTVDHLAESSSRIVRHPLPFSVRDVEPPARPSGKLKDAADSSYLCSVIVNQSAAATSAGENADDELPLLRNELLPGFESWHWTWSKQPGHDRNAALRDVLDFVDGQNTSRLIHNSPNPHGVTFSSLFKRLGVVLDRCKFYDSEFCRIPLTSDLEANPYKCRSTLESEPMLLMHSVMALTGHHVNSPTAEDHHQTALRLLRESLNSPRRDIREYEPLIDAIIILFTYGSAKSISGSWAIHLMGAKSIIEASGGIKKWTDSPRSQAQVAVLTWWDAVYSIFSREDCVLPSEYFEVVNSKRSNRQWDYFDLCGCPVELARITRTLAHLSSEKRKSSSTQYVTFDESAISAIEEQLNSWRYESSPNAFSSEEHMQRDQDQMHVSEAWRNGLLLYVYRVFRWEPGSRSPIHLAYRARVILDHLFACRQDQVFPKQALLPLFLAGCELKDRSMRESIVQLCMALDRATRYHYFREAIPLLRDVWHRQEMDAHDSVWWGLIVDQYHAVSDPLQSRLCIV